MPQQHSPMKASETSSRPSFMSKSVDWIAAEGEHLESSHRKATVALTPRDMSRSFALATAMGIAGATDGTGHPEASNDSRTPSW